ncbi:MAG: alcohol dehydrogenase catalytic domain-containing protein, partial [Myxococcota bacterium]
MRALVIGNNLPRLILTRMLAFFSPRAYTGRISTLGLREIPAPELPAADWVIARTKYCGLCGSDYKQVFMNGAFDNPMTGLISWPQVLGHEVVGVVEEVGEGVRKRRVGERVVLNPWLSCGPRGLPPCRWCEEGDYAQCTNFAEGSPLPGIHTGNSASATGGFAPLVPAHESQWIPIPDDVSDEAAVLADPFAVSLHAILRNPPTPGGNALVYGAGTLGLLAVAILRALHPDVEISVIARYRHQSALAETLGAHRVIPHQPTRDIIEEASRATSAEPMEPWRGLPMLNGGFDVVYDTVSSAETLEVGVRIVRSRARIVALGVEPPRRFEWTPLYFKEIALVGSNGFGVEEYDGRKQHAIDWYFEFIRTRRID